MPKAEFGSDLNLPRGGGQYVKLVSKGDKIKFRIAGTPTYHVDHWIGEKGAREKVACTKYNTDDKDAQCGYCDDYKKAVDAGDKDVAKDIKPTTTFLYPILNRETGEAAIFQFTAASIHYKISNYAKAGVDVLACDWLVERTEEPGSGYYDVMRLDAGTLSAEEKEELERAGGFNLGGRESSSVGPEPDGSEDIEPDEVA